MKKFVLFLGVVFSLTWIIACSTDSETKTDLNSVESTRSDISNKRIHIDDKIGEIISGNFVITVNMSDFQGFINQTLIDEAISASIVSFEIQESSDTAGIYFLVGKNSSGSVKTGTQLIRNGNNFYIDYFVNTSTNQLDVVTVVCDAGCREGCDPQSYKNENDEQLWRCTQCVQFTGQGCRKTVTTTTNTLKAP